MILNKIRLNMQNTRRLKKIWKYKLEIAKKGGWDKSYKQVDLNHWGLTYEIVMKKLVSRREACARDNAVQTFEWLVDTIFPWQVRIKCTSIVKNTIFSEVTCEIIKEFAHSIVSRKYSGPNEILDIVIKEVAKSRTDIISKVLNLCFRDGYFLLEWSEASLSKDE